MLLVAVGAIPVASWVGSLLTRRQPAVPPAEHFPRRMHYLVLALLFTLFAVYGSLLPFNYTPLSLHRAIDRFQDIPLLELGVEQERADWVATILFFVPLGFLWLAAIAVDERSRGFCWLAACLAGLGGAGLSVAIEFAQLWFPPRTVSQNDVLAATGGSLLGILAWLLVGQLLTHWLRAYSWSRDRETRVLWLLRGYFTGLIVFSVLPMDFILSPTEIGLKYQEGRIEIIPFMAVITGHVPWSTPLSSGLVWLPVGLLVARGSLRKDAPRWRLNGPAAMAAVLAVEIVRLLVFTRYASTTHVLMGWCGVGTGVWLAGRWQRIVRGGKRPFPMRFLETRVWPWLALTVLYAMVVVAVACAPWQFGADSLVAAARFAGFLRAPFASLYWGSKFNAVTDVLQKLALFLPLGALVARSILPLRLAPPLKRLAFLLGLAAATAVALTIEMIQVFQTVHFVDITDVLLGAAGAAAGIYLVTSTAEKRSAAASATSAASLLVIGWYSLVVLAGAGVFLGVRAWCVTDPAVALRPAEVAQRPAEQTESGPQRPSPSGEKVGRLPGILRKDSEKPSQAISYAAVTGSYFTAIPTDPYQSPHFVPITIPRFPGGHAIWGATGRDRRGHLWFGISTPGGVAAPAHLCEYLPEAGRVVDRGDVVSELKRCGVYRAGECQMKIHSRIVQGGDGHLYFASMDEQGEDENGSRLPTWGSHMWRLRLPENRWEHLFAAPEGLIAVAGAGEWIYALGYFGHVLYQYPLRSGRVRSVVVGSIDGHISRNFLCDHRGHVYVPRLRRDRDGPQGIRVTLVELDENLRELAATALRHYTRRSPTDAHGIVAFQYLADRSIVFATDIGFLYRIYPHDGAPAEVRELGWFHPDGEAYVASMFTWDGQRYVMGVSDRNHRYEWLVFDLTGNRSRAIAIPPSEPLHRAPYVYGSVTRDNAGRCFVVGSEPEETIAITPDVERALLAVGVARDDVALLHSTGRGQRAAIFRVEFSPARAQVP